MGTPSPTKVSQLSQWFSPHQGPRQALAEVRNYNQQPCPYALGGLGIKSPTDPGPLSLGPGVRAAHFEHTCIPVIVLVLLASNSHNEPMS